MRKWLMHTVLLVLLFGALHLLLPPQVDDMRSLILGLPPLVLLVAYDWVNVVGQGRRGRGSDAGEDKL